MSKNQGNKVERNNIMKLKPQKIPSYSRVKLQTNSKQNLKDLIMDYIIQNHFNKTLNQKTNKISKPNSYKNQANFPIEIQLQTNTEKRKITLNLQNILEKYLQFQNKNLYKQTNIQSLVMEILNFFDQMQEIADFINLEITTQKELPDQLITRLLEKYNNDKQKIIRIKQLDLLKCKSIKYTKFNPTDNNSPYLAENSLDSSQRVSRDTITSSIADKESTQSKEIKGTKSKLKDLVDKYKVFQHPEKVQKLRKDKMKELYEGPDIDRITQTTNQQSNNLIDNKTPNTNQDYLEFLKDWITEISISEKLFQNKIQQKETKVKQNQTKVGKIIEESEDEDDKQSLNDTEVNL